VFEAGAIPWYWPAAGFACFSAAAVAAIPALYPPAKWHFVLVAVLVAPLLALPNSYGCGLTDWDNASLFGKIALFAFAGWAGKEVSARVFVRTWKGGARGAHTHTPSQKPTTPRQTKHPTTKHPTDSPKTKQNQGVIAGLVICGVVLSACSSAAVLMQDFRTGYITLSSPVAMFVSQVCLCGGCVWCDVRASRARRRQRTLNVKPPLPSSLKNTTTHVRSSAR
jgi:hypothetical protein